MPRKPRTDAVLLHLPMEQQKQLCEWLLDGGLGYRAAALAMEAEFKVKTSATAVFDFYHTVCAPELLRRRSVAVSTAEDIAVEAKATPGRWDEAAIDKLKQFVFELMLNPHADPKEVKAVYGLVLKARDQDIAKAKLEAATKSKIEQGLAALMEEIQGNERAMVLFRELEDVVSKA